jgi:hypothetical protein
MILSVVLATTDHTCIETSSAVAPDCQYVAYSSSTLYTACKQAALVSNQDAGLQGPSFVLIAPCGTCSIRSSNRCCGDRSSTSAGSCMHVFFIFQIAVLPHRVLLCNAAAVSAVT